MTQPIQEVYAGLGEVLEHPEAFGLGDQVPPTLAFKLLSMRRMLEEAIKEFAKERPEGDLAAELSQDFDDASDRPQS
jgi:hypothetical protein